MSHEELARHFLALGRRPFRQNDDRTTQQMRTRAEDCDHTEVCPSGHRLKWDRLVRFILIERIVLFGRLRWLVRVGSFRFGPVAVCGWGKHLHEPGNDVVRFALVAVAVLSKRFLPYV
jgi:hypothetical protein